jgi:hypothetical protein
LAKATLRNLLERAQEAIDREEDVCFDLCADACPDQIFGNVSHMGWFKWAVAGEIAANTKKYEHLFEEVDKRRGI